MARKQLGATPSVATDTATKKYVDDQDATKQPLDSDLTTIAGLTATTDSFLQSKASAWTTRTPAQVLADLAALGTTFQPLDSDLTTIAGLTATTDNFMVANGSAWASRTPTQARTHMGLAALATLATVGTSQIDDAAVTLAKMANLAQDQFIGRTTASTGVPQTATITAAARTVLDDTTVSAMIDTLGGTAAQGSGAIVRATSPALTTPNLGTPTALTLTNATGLPTAGMLDDAVTAAKMLNGMVKQRQGGSSGDASWLTAGTTNVDTSAKSVKIQVGSITAPSNTTKTVTYPETFSQVPLIFALVQSATSNNQVRLYVRDATTSQFTLGSLDVGTEIVAWMAIGQ